MALTLDDIRDTDMCGACRDELLGLFTEFPNSIREHEVEMARLRRRSDLGLCGAHTAMLGPALYRMLKAGGFVVDED